MTVLAIISTLISSIALLGVVVSLLLQARQLRVSQLQASRAAQLELVKMAMDNPKMAGSLYGYNDPETYSRWVYLNWLLRYYELSYQMRDMTKASLKREAEALFKTEDSRNWWLMARGAYEVAATTRRAREFFVMVDVEFQRAMRPAETTQSDQKATPPKPSDPSFPS